MTSKQLKLTPKLFMGMVAGLAFVIAVACSGDSESTADETLPTSTPPPARAAKPNIAPELQTNKDVASDAGDATPRQGGVFNT